MENDDDAPVTGRDEVLIDADPDTVWEVLTDVARWPDWRPGLESVDVDGPIASGASFSWTVAGRTTAVTVEQAQHPQAISWEERTDDLVVTRRWTLEPYERSTMVKTEESRRGDAVGADREGAQAEVDRSLHEWVTDLKAIVEAPALEGHA